MKKLTTVVGITLTFLLTYFAVTGVGSVNAENFSGTYLLLNRVKGGLTSGVEMTLAITPASSTGGSDTITIVFPDSEDGSWCKTGGGTSLTVTGVTSSPADSSGNYDITAAVPGTLVGTCTAGSGAASYDTVTISGVGAMTAGTTYGVNIDNNLADFGTAAAGEHIVTVNLTDSPNQQTMSFEVETISEDTINVTANVANAPTITCTLSGTGGVNIGTLYKGGAYSTASHTLQVSTSSDASGYYTAVYGTGNTTDAGLYNGSSYLIESDYAGGTMDLTSAEGYGIVASAPTGATVATNFADSTPGTFGTLGVGFAEAKMLFYQGSAETGGDTSTIVHGAAAGASATVGSYSENVTFLCGGYY